MELCCSFDGPFEVIVALGVFVSLCGMSVADWVMDVEALAACDWLVVC